MTRLYVYLLLFWGVSLFALLRGGRDERLVAVIYAAGVIVSPYLQRPQDEWFLGVEPGLLAVDVLAFLSVAVVALSSRKFWPLWMTWLLGVMLLAHLSPLLGPAISRRVYAEAETLWSYPQLILLGIATWAHRRGRTRPRVAPA